MCTPASSQQMCWSQPTETGLPYKGKHHETDVDWPGLARRWSWMTTTINVLWWVWKESARICEMWVNPAATTSSEFDWVFLFVCELYFRTCYHVCQTEVVRCDLLWFAVECGRSPWRSLNKNVLDFVLRALLSVYRYGTLEQSATIKGGLKWELTTYEHNELRSIRYIPECYVHPDNMPNINWYSLYYQSFQIEKYIPSTVMKVLQLHRSTSNSLNVWFLCAAFSEIGHYLSPPESVMTHLDSAENNTTLTR